MLNDTGRVRCQLSHWCFCRCILNIYWTLGSGYSPEAPVAKPLSHCSHSPIRKNNLVSSASRLELRRTINPLPHRTSSPFSKWSSLTSIRRALMSAVVGYPKLVEWCCRATRERVELAERCKNRRSSTYRPLSLQPTIVPSHSGQWSSKSMWEA